MYLIYNVSITNQSDEKWDKLQKNSYHYHLYKVTEQIIIIH